VDFAINERTLAFQTELRAFLDEQLTDDIRQRVARTGTQHDWTFHRALAERGWIGAAWPVEEGGQGRDAFEMEILYQELAAAGAPTDGFSITMIIAETLRRLGTANQRVAFLPRIQAGKIIFSLGYSEPNVGSDLAAVQTSAVREGDAWRINGQKVFTTMAHEASYVFLLARTNPDRPRHKGLTVFIIPTETPGFSLAPVQTLGGERTNVTYYVDLMVPDALRVGEMDEGWAVVMTALAFERGGEFAAQLRRLVEATADWIAAEQLQSDRRLLRRLGRVVADAEVSRLLGARASWLRSGERAGDLEGSMAKLYATEALLAGAGELLDAAGPRGMLAPGAPGAPAHGHIQQTYRHAQVTTIYGGTSEILRSMIAERRLGLPRSRPATPSTEKSRLGPGAR
jgi:alkylation response protein AidB-like acyl-CoA dehydrogenase